MEVTKANFQAILPKIKSAIAKATFIAIDCELTGLNTNLNSKVNTYDTQAQYYGKLLKASREFLAIQYGLCIFRYDTNQKVFKQQGYNFYIFPQKSNKLAPDRIFLCQASSIDFLVSQGFDFNKLFKNGISYLNSVEEDKYREELLEKQKTRVMQIHNASNNEMSNSGINVSPEDRARVDDIFNKIEKFISSDNEEFVLPRCNAFIRRLVYGEAAVKLTNRATLETRTLENKDRVLAVTRIKSKDTVEEGDRKKVEEEEKEFQDSIGFSEVIKCIIESGKIVVGHNMVFDILHTIEKFLVPLPEDYDEFKEIASSLFTSVIDTKYMSSITPFNHLVESSVLSHLLDTVKKFGLPPVELENGTEGYTLETEKAHEAGYDAFITGICFLGLWKYLGNFKDYESNDAVFNDPSALARFKNRLFLMKIQDIPYIHLGENDVIPKRDHVLYFKFPKEWKHSEIVSLFSPFGSINIAWIDDQSAYIGLSSSGKAAMALSTLSQSETYTITTWAKHQTQLEEVKLPSSSSDGNSSNSLKTTLKKRTTSLTRKRSFSAIQETTAEAVSDSFNVVPQISGLSSSAKKPKKTFNEDINWS